MRFQLNVFLEVLKRSLKYICFFIIILAFDIFIFFSKSVSIEEIAAKFDSYTAVPSLGNMGNVYYLVCIYIIFLFLFFFLLFFNYEKFHSYEGVALRFNSKKCFIYKLLYGEIFIIAFSLLYYFTIYLNFKSYVDFDFMVYFKLLLFYNIIMMCTITLSYNYKRVVGLIIMSSISILAILKFDIAYAVIVIIIVCIYNYCTYNIRSGGDMK